MISNKCPECGFPRIKNGVRKLKKKGSVQQWICKNCSCQERDIEYKGFWFQKIIVDAAISLRHCGLSLKIVKHELKNIFGVTVKSLSTIWTWCQIFASHAITIFKNLAKILHIDETVIWINGKKAWFWAAKCPKTKVIVGHHISLSRSEEEARKFLWDVRRHLPISIKEWPKAIRTDSMPSYISRNKQSICTTDKAIQIQVVQRTWKQSNRNIFSLQKQISKIQNHRSSKKLCKRMDKIIHDTTGKTPAEMCGINFFAIFFRIFIPFSSCTY